jgi:hypothetical protein
VYFYSVGIGCAVNLTSGLMIATPNYSVSNGIAGFWDGTYIHAFYVGFDGNVYELYAATSTITSCASYGSWNWHQIGGGGHAAH